MNASNDRSRRVIIPADIHPSALRGAGSGLTVCLLEGETMGTYWRCHFQQPTDIPERRVRECIERSFGLVVQQMSHWDEHSELSRFNASPENQAMRLSPEFFTVLEKSLTIAELTDGAYDPTVGKLVSLNGFGPTPSATQTQSDFSNAHRGWKQISLNPTDQTARHDGHCHLDLSSIAKGYAIDLASSRLLRLGIENHLLEIGGEFIGHGCKPDGQPWWTVLDPLGGQSNQQTEEIVIAMCGIALATSGIAENQIESEGRITHHLIDPSTGHCTSGNLLAVSVIASTCMEADAWATALFILGREKAKHLAEQQKIAASFTFIEDEILTESHTLAFSEMLDDDF
ncbi:FAD:protein FMN transferase [Oceaniferula spumae]|uniref:FAD:protein FMN transferase n=1 Tax=Oceaniferula spumae TaxID=2979115 RepID=A0AAT9FQW0_9BACT